MTGPGTPREGPARDRSVLELALGLLGLAGDGVARGRDVASGAADGLAGGEAEDAEEGNKS